MIHARDCTGVQLCFVCFMPVIVQVCNCVSSVAGTEWFITLHPHNSSPTSLLVVDVCNSWLLSAVIGIRSVACHIVSNVVRNVQASVLLSVLFLSCIHKLNVTSEFILH